jgi:hypothetical protein
MTTITSTTWHGPKANPQIQAIVAAGNQADALSQQLASLESYFSWKIKGSFQQRYSDYLKNPANPHYQNWFTNMITDLKGYMSGIFQLNNEVQQATDNLNQMVAFMDRDMNKLKNENASLETELVENVNEKRSTQQLVLDNQVAYKVEKYKFFFYFAGLLYLVYFTLFRIFKLNLGNKIAAIGEGAKEILKANPTKEETPTTKEETPKSETKEKEEPSSSSSSSSSS